MRQLAYWTGAAVELVLTPIRENNPWLGIIVVAFLVVEVWMIIYTVGSWR